MENGDSGQVGLQNAPVASHAAEVHAHKRGKGPAPIPHLGMVVHNVAAIQQSTKHIHVVQQPALRLH
ncbi:hypothetical protein CHS0354_016062 [Potamilus streckersoni]|uniref:Uncharacterized protein n=1 Tax=Potamilus streckersoni TaxID=2493646 RepID=A0AAE0T0Z3_9BIVA|nr:hypothetical protein CHS0354_016062 [Potamilus streckersoni]